MAPTWNLDWLAHNAVRAYPIVAGTDRKDQTGDFVLPNDFLLALQFSVSPAIAATASRFFVRSIGAFATGYSLVVGYQPEAGSAVNVATAQFARNAHTRNQQYSLSGIGDFSDASGRIVVGNLDAIDLQPTGFWTFDLEETRLETDCIFPYIRGIRSIRVRNGADLSQPIYDHIELEAGSNYQLVLTESEGQYKIRFNAIEGEGLNSDCGCDEVSGNPILSINDVTGDETGNIDVIGTECLEVQSIENGLMFHDACAKPCCGDPELLRLAEDLRLVGNQLLSLENLSQRLKSGVDVAESIWLGSRLSDQSCNSCE